MMRIQVVFNKDGTSQHTVKERSEGENCTLVYNMTSKAGTLQSDEITGPDCSPNVESETSGT